MFLKQYLSESRINYILLDADVDSMYTLERTCRNVADKLDFFDIPPTYSKATELDELYLMWWTKEGEFHLKVDEDLNYIARYKKNLNMFDKEMVAGDASTIVEESSRLWNKLRLF